MIQEFQTADDILKFALGREQESIDLYTNLADTARNPEMRKVFSGFADEERGHKKRIENIQSSGQFQFTPAQVRDIKIGDYLIDVEPHAGMSYQEALIIAMKKEKAAFRLYSDLAARVEDQLLRSLFESLAQEESKHKLRFELEYDEVVLKDN
ncbi:MAG: rubrerythrin [Chloroflexi bacterium HGW-Chloroflexi-5]|jgi:rubrerythrin|nr:MAG: rubrerythrin [Chloroflexi bacterium HGW-Chloroflexi-5]PKP05051.1 MAG: rubrerythrin [Bacteroidetes bacterium HGW-Bacteroidetes-6]